MNCSEAWWPRIGDVFDGVVHPGIGEEPVQLRVEALTADNVVLSGDGGKSVRPGDILTGEVCGTDRDR